MKSKLGNVAPTLYSPGGSPDIERNEREDGPQFMGATTSSNGFSVVEVVRALWARRKLLGLLSLAGAVIGLVLGFVMPPTFEAVTTVIHVPPQGSQFPVVGANAATGAADELDAILGGSPQRTMLLYPDLIRSRYLLEGLLRSRFALSTPRDSATLIDLVQPHGAGALRVEFALKRLRRLIGAVIDKRSGLLTIRVRSRDPVVAAGVANLLVARLQEFGIRSMAGNAGENRRFIEGRLTETRTELTRVESELEVFRQNNLRIGNSPHLQLELERHMRDVRVQEEIYLALTREYELARVEEHRDVPVINTLDTAAVPAQRQWPRRGLMAALGCVLGAGMGGVWVLARQGLLPG